MHLRTLQVFTFGLLVEMNEFFVEERLADKRHCVAWSELEEETKFIGHVPSASEKIFTGFRLIVEIGESVRFCRSLDVPQRQVG